MIGVYVHNHGRGHLHRVLPVVTALLDRGEDVTILVAGPLDPALRPPGSRVVHLPPASGDEVLPGDIGLAARRAAVAWIDRVRPRAFWVDASPDMSLAARMTGTPVVGTLTPGLRDDEPHRLSCRAAERLIGAWPPGSHEETVSLSDSRVSEIGGVSRFEGRDPEPRIAPRPRVVHLNGSGTAGDSRFWNAVRTTADELGVADWLEVGGPDGRWHEDPWPELCSADVVVTAAGQAAVADAACADVPLVVVPGRREFGEQDATAAALDLIPGAVVKNYGDGPRAVAHAVRRQVDLGRAGGAGGIREEWGVDGASSRAADVIATIGAPSVWMD